MNRIRLTDKLIAGTEAPGKTWDDDARGMALLVTPNGHKSYVIGYRPPGGGNFKTMALGAVGKITLEEARQLSREAFALLGRQIDPADAAREAKRSAEFRVCELLAESGPYEKHLHTRQLHKAKSALNTLRTYLRPIWRNDVRTLSTADMVGAINASKNKGDVRKHARVFLNWAIAAGIITDKNNVLKGWREETPTRAQRVTKRAANDNQGRVLSPEEIVRLWLATEGDDPFFRIVRLALLVGTRRHEAAGLATAWAAEDHVDRETGFHYGPSIELPDSFTKQGREHYIPLTAELRKFLAAATPGNGLYFPGPRAGKAFNNWTARVKELRKASGIATFCMHDLRRTAITYMSMVGFDDRVGFMERDALARFAVGHGRTGLSGIYNKDARWDERRQGFERWQAHVAKLVADATVLPIAA